MRTLYYYFAVIARSIEGDESDAAIPGDLSLFELWRDRHDDEWWSMIHSTSRYSFPG
ncbi:MAG: hypothetical protein GXP52_06695 [Deltaproteobacteria bacterium]|nr:hypothetical protein [Deltaproteobacteria bacterium]